MDTDVVIVGGGIGGASLAGVLARGGLDVTVLEATTVYTDRVRGESLQPWGVREAQLLGVEPVLVGAGAHYAATWRTFDAHGRQLMELPMGMMVPGVTGSLNLAHPTACQALLEAAAAAGARVQRGVEDVTIASGPTPEVTYLLDGQTAGLRTTLVVGADGRGSTVRRQTGISLERQEAITYIAGLVVEGLDGVADDHDVLVSDDGQYSLLFHQGGGRARSYLCTGLSARRRFAGRSGTEAFLTAAAASAHPAIAAIADATPAGPCAAYAGDDTWTATPYAEGVVLIGDAAGHNDPIIGQGLSIALRDARTVAELVLDGARGPAAFAPYGAERFQRMARLRLVADIMGVVQAEDADNQPARRARFTELTNDPEATLLALMVASVAGPDTVPEEIVDPTWPDRLRAA